MMSKKKIFLYIAFALGGFWGVLQMFHTSGPDANEVYKMADKLYGRSLEDINAIMKMPGKRQATGQYYWEINEDESWGSVLSCIFDDEHCVAASYGEAFRSKKQASKRYNALLDGLSKKFGVPVRDGQGNFTWFRGDRKITLLNMFFREKDASTVMLIIKGEN